MAKLKFRNAKIRRGPDFIQISGEICNENDDAGFRPFNARNNVDPRWNHRIGAPGHEIVRFSTVERRAISVFCAAVIAGRAPAEEIR